MQVRELMSSPAITVSPTTQIREVARIMRENVISGVPVVDDAGKLLGVITEMELIARNAPVHEPTYLAVLSALIPVNLEEYRQYKEQLRQALATNALELMRDEVETISPDASIEEALESMLNPEVTMLPVVEDGRVIGVVTRTDLVRLIETLEAAPDEPSEA
jgi:CBS domain-containing protein